MRSRSFLLLAVAVAVEFVSAALPRAGMAAEAPPGFAAVVQIGPEGTWAIEIAPNRSWFLTGTQAAIVISDLRTGAILRQFASGASARFTRMTISADGRVVLARIARDTVDDTETMGWLAETGAPINDAAALAPPLDASSWAWIEPKRPSPWPFDTPHDLQAEKNYLVDRQLASLVNLEKVQSVELTDRQGIIQVTTSGETQDEAEEEVWAYHVYFIDLTQKKIVADISGKTLHTFCGRPHGAFAFDGQHLLLAPTELDASSSNINALLVDMQSVPPRLKWSRPCQDTQVSGMAFERGLVLVWATPDQVTVWDPITARRIIHIDDIHDSEVLTWSTDLTTFATGFHERRTIADPHTYGVAVVRSGKKLFFPTDAEVSEIRLGEDGSKIFVRTDSVWSAWDALTGAKLSSFSVPAATRSEDNRYDGGMGTASTQSLAVRDKASRRLLWQAIASDGAAQRDFLIVQYADGRVLVSDGAEDLVKFVRGFEVRPFGASPRQ
jgi:hypothetical protein